jgi:hypothetical protein
VLAHAPRRTRSRQIFNVRNFTLVRHYLYELEITGRENEKTRDELLFPALKFVADYGGETEAATATKKIELPEVGRNVEADEIY